MTAESFFQGLPFAPDPFQVEAAQSIASGRTVVVTAPTFRPQAAISLERTRQVIHSYTHLVPIAPRVRDHVLEVAKA